jgi:hypothetical protein
MPIHTRNLPTNSRTVLDELVDPNARHDRSTRDEAPLSPKDREAAAPRETESPPRPTFSEESHASGGPDLPWYRREKWLTVQISAMVPILGAMFVPATYRLPLCVLGGALIAVGTVMLLRHKPMPASSGSGSA